MKRVEVELFTDGSNDAVEEAAELLLSALDVTLLRYTDALDRHDPHIPHARHSLPGIA